MHQRGPTSPGATNSRRYFDRTAVDMPGSPHDVRREGLGRIRATVRAGTRGHAGRPSSPGCRKICAAHGFSMRGAAPGALAFELAQARRRCRRPSTSRRHWSALPASARQPWLGIRLLQRSGPAICLIRRWEGSTTSSRWTASSTTARGRHRCASSGRAGRSNTLGRLLFTIAPRTAAAIGDARRWASSSRAAIASPAIAPMAPPALLRSLAAPPNLLPQGEEEPSSPSPLAGDWPR